MPASIIPSIDAIAITQPKLKYDTIQYTFRKQVFCLNRESSFSHIHISVNKARMIVMGQSSLDGTWLI